MIQDLRDGISAFFAGPRAINERNQGRHREDAENGANVASSSATTAVEVVVARQRELDPDRVLRSSGVKNAVIAEEGLSVLDLREVPSIRVRIVGTGYWVTESGLYKHGGTDYLLVREPKNQWDANAIGVYGKGRKLGHLSAGKAAALAPVLDPLGFDAYRIGGAPISDNSSRIWADVPAIPKLRSFAKTVAKARS